MNGSDREYTDVDVLRCPEKNIRARGDAALFGEHRPLACAGDRLGRRVFESNPPGEPPGFTAEPAVLPGSIAVQNTPWHWCLFVFIRGSTAWFRHI